MTESDSDTEGEKTPKKHRKHPRVKCDWKVRVVNTEKKQLMARAQNVSIGGIMIETPRKYQIGENLYLEIQAHFLGTYKLMKVVGRVVYIVFRSGSFKIGLQFATDTTDFDAFLREYVHRKSE